MLGGATVTVLYVWGWKNNGSLCWGCNNISSVCWGIKQQLFLLLEEATLQVLRHLKKYHAKGLGYTTPKTLAAITPKVLHW